MDAARKAIESLYKDRCDVYEMQKSRDEETKVTSEQEVKVVEQKRCRLSYQTVTSVDQDKVPHQTQTILLFLEPELTIKPSSKIVVEHCGVRTAYKMSGKPALHTNHQEIVLKLFDKYA